MKQPRKSPPSVGLRVALVVSISLVTIIPGFETRVGVRAGAATQYENSRKSGADSPMVHYVAAHAYENVWIQHQDTSEGQAISPGMWSPSGALAHTISRNQDDGTETDGMWHQDGYAPGLNYLGSSAEGERFTAALRFRVTDLSPGERVEYGRLRLAIKGGDIGPGLRLRIRGAHDPGGVILSNQRIPSQLPRTAASVSWNIMRLPSVGTKIPLYRNSPDIADIINEIVSRPGWDSSQKCVTLLIEPAHVPRRRASYISVSDHFGEGARQHLPLLEIYKTIDDAFIARPMLGSPTDRSVTVNVINLVAIDIYAEYGIAPGRFTHSTRPLLGRAAQQPVDIVIDGLRADTEYCYRLRYRRAGQGRYRASREFKFRTQAAKRTCFTFTIQADSHILSAATQGDMRRVKLYRQTLDNVLEDDPDFHIDMGDFAHTEFYAALSARSLQDAAKRYLFQRKCLEAASHSVPFYLVLGNHEGEQGWRTTQGQDSLEVWGILARKAMIPNPCPDGFYSGNEDTMECCGLREDYYAWQWGDALFVVLDPFGYTMTRPHSTRGLYKPTLDGWVWTLGKTQYDWLYTTLHQSGARWKFVFAHHMVGGVLGGKRGVSPYGRGGIDAAKFRVAGRPSFEWGGEDAAGNYVFEAKRPGWSHGPIHDILVQEGVDIFFRGHDHAFIYEELDGVVYQTCPQPANDSYSDGEYRPAFFSTGIPRNNSGHIRVSVTPDSVKVDYVRSVLPEDEPLIENDVAVHNRTISYSYTIKR